MLSLRTPSLLVVALAIAVPFAPAPADARPTRSQPAKRVTHERAGRDDGKGRSERGRKRADAKRRERDSDTEKVCTGRGRKRKCTRRKGRFVAHGVPRSSLRVEPLPRPSGDVWVYATNFGLEARVNLYNPDGSYNQESLARLDEIFRCRRTRELHAVEPRLYEVLSILGDHFGARINVGSGFRYQLNEGSRHFSAAAMDLTIPGVSYRDLFQFAESLDLGGMGVGQYPRQGFVHIDFRAPGEPSMRWTDTTGARRSAGGRAPSRMWRKPRS